MITCEWFAKCDNDTVTFSGNTITFLRHPVLGPTPCCTRCAAQVGATNELEEAELVS